MSRHDLFERLSQMVALAEDGAATEQTIIARRYAAKGMLQSGNFFADEKRALESHYENSLRRMEAHALSVAAPNKAAKAVKSAGLELESKFLTRFEGILGGSESGNPCDAKASEKLLSEFRAFARERLLQASSDTENNVSGRQVRGWQGWIIRYGWNAINTMIAAVALYLAWTQH